MALLSSAEYPAIRAAIDVSLDSALLPDAVIALDLYVGAGQRDVLAIDPAAETRTGDDLLHAKTAAIMFTAARLIGSVPLITREQRDTHGYTRQEVDPAQRAADLRTLASAEIDAYLDPGDLASDRPTRFAVVSGRRGRW